MNDKTPYRNATDLQAIEAAELVVQDAWMDGYCGEQWVTKSANGRLTLWTCRAEKHEGKLHVGRVFRGETGRPS